MAATVRLRGSVNHDAGHPFTLGAVFDTRSADAGGQRCCGRTDTNRATTARTPTTTIHGRIWAPARAITTTVPITLAATTSSAPRPASDQAAREKVPGSGRSEERRVGEGGRGRR